MTVFTGTFHRSLDSKLRVLLPKRLRQALDENTEIYLTPGTDQCLELHTDSSLNEMATRVRESATDSRNLKSFSRLFYARAQHCEIDNQGRVRIPVELAELAQLQKEIVLVGIGFHWELWDKERWLHYLQGNGEQFDLISANTFDLISDQKLKPASSPHGGSDSARQDASHRRVAK